MTRMEAYKSGFDPTCIHLWGEGPLSSRTDGIDGQPRRARPRLISPPLPCILSVSFRAIRGSSSVFSSGPWFPRRARDSAFPKKNVNICIFFLRSRAKMLKGWESLQLHTPPTRFYEPKIRHSKNQFCHTELPDIPAFRSLSLPNARTNFLPCPILSQPKPARKTPNRTV